ncbi:MAG TPA: sugar phosphate isomerase/epimerase family protein [Verrucomicrobiae bacterium]|jgi:sugar phosphate isomerase/epimerase
MQSPLTRREFLLGTSAALLCAATPLAATPTLKNRICAFEKPVQFLSDKQLAATMSDIGFSGIEATVRAGGRVLPTKVENDLARLHEALDKRGLEIAVIATDILNTTQPRTEPVLRAAAKLGIRRYRMASYLYDMSRPILPQLDAIASRLPALIDLTQELGMTAVYHNHSGPNRVGAAVWDIYGLIKTFDPRVIGIGFDIQHAMIEGGLDWRIQFKLVQSHLEMVYVKDFFWDKSEVKEVPLGEGIVDRKFFPMLLDTGYTGPICLHVEYLEGKKNQDALETAFRKDLATLRLMLAS